MSSSSVQWFSNLNWEHFASVSHFVIIQSLRHLDDKVVVRIRCTFSEGVRSLPHPLTVDGRQRIQHFLWPSLPCPFWSFFVPRVREELLEVVVDNVSASLQIFHSRSCHLIPISPRSEHVSEVVAFASVMAAFLKWRSACLRRITCRALYRAMDNLSFVRCPFSQRRSRQSLRTFINAGSCFSRHAFPRFTAPHAMADLAMAVVSGPSVGMDLCDAVSILVRSVGPVHLVSRTENNVVKRPCGARLPLTVWRLTNGG